MRDDIQTKSGGPTTKALFPGSFNPFTKGHADILRRALRLWPEVVVAIGYNPRKTSREDIESRERSLRESIPEMEGASVASYTGLTVDFARSIGAGVIVRGVRGFSDFEYEKEMADVNSRISDIETVFLPSRPELSCVSSSMVRELEMFGYDVTDFLPEKK